MAKRIELLNAGQAPTLLDTTKGNELIQAINSVMDSKASEKASSIGLRLIVEQGSLILDATNELASALEKLRETNESGDGGDGDDGDGDGDSGDSTGNAPIIPEGYSERTVSLVDNGTISSVTILVKD